AGSYTLTATIADPGGMTATSSVNVTVGQTVARIAVSPASATLVAGAAQPFTVVADDQFGNPWTEPPAWSWSVLAGGGEIDGSGLYTAPYANGTATVRVTGG